MQQKECACITNVNKMVQYTCCFIEEPLKEKCEFLLEKKANQLFDQVGFY